MNRIGITYDNAKYVRTLHELKLFVSPVGEQNCIHGMVHGMEEPRTPKQIVALNKL